MKSVRILIILGLFLSSAQQLGAFAIRNCAQGASPIHCWENGCPNGYRLHALYAPVGHPENLQEVTIAPGKFMGEIMHHGVATYQLSFMGLPKQLEPDTVAIAHNASIIIKGVNTFKGDKRRFAVYENTEYDTGGFICCGTEVRHYPFNCSDFRPSYAQCFGQRTGCSGPGAYKSLRILAATDGNPFDEYTQFLDTFAYALDAFNKTQQQKYASPEEELEKLSAAIAALEESKKEFDWYREFMGELFTKEDTETQFLLSHYPELIKVNDRIKELQEILRQKDITEIKSLSEQYPVIKKFYDLVNAQTEEINALRAQVKIFENAGAQRLLNEQQREELHRKGRQAEMAMNVAVGFAQFLYGITGFLRTH